ncbi:hypothetical protein DPMN_101257 [Dreissena polymorpha]|uniref:Uncharacterized protein n=1 Tax=Dreissena polymorpha TaxID=45954 RepID=A0A9D4R856_DREPO|nr:hypothetical protein DPMN_101257 [Dreissena polymorpha]
MHEYLSDIYYRVSDQYSKAAHERRRKLVPNLIHVRKDGKHVTLSNDALYVDRVLVTHHRACTGDAIMSHGINFVATPEVTELINRV